MNMRTKSAWLRVLVLVPLLLGVAVDADAQRTCCHRELTVMPVALPDGQEQDAGAVSTFFRGMVQGPLEMATLNCACPSFDWKNAEAMKAAYIQMQAINAALRRRDHLPPLPPTSTTPEEDLDYVFVGTLTADHVTGKTKRECDPESPGDCWGGNLEGTFTFHLKLFDHHHGQTLKEGSVSWTGHIWLDVGDRVKELSKSLFLPLDTLIQDYERIAEHGRVEVPDDLVDAGSTTTIRLLDLRDDQSRPTQWWQRILVKVDHGKILNADERSEEYYVFKAGKDAAVTVQYRAPDGCKPDKDTLTVFNSCEKRKKYTPGSKKQIATKTFDITCDRWDVTVTYTEQVTVNRNPDEGLTQMSRNYSITLKGRVHFKERRGSELWYESASASIELADSFNRHDVLRSGTPPKEFKSNATWGATKSGQVPMTMRVRFAPKFHKYSVGWLPWQGDPIVYKGTYQWSGWQYLPRPEGAFEFTCREIVNALPDWPPGQQPFAEGQTVLKGQSSWRDPSSSVVVDGAPFVDMSQECTLPSNAVTPNPLSLVGVIDPITNPYAKTISWEVRRPQ